MRTSRDMMKRNLFRVYKLGTRLGFYFLPAHYYIPEPNIIELEKTQDVWAKKSELPGIHVDLDEQVNTLKAACLPYQKEYTGNPYYLDAVANHFGPGYGYIEAEALHGFIRHYKPQQVIEVGSGVSTYCMVKAQAINFQETGQSAKITSIEPYPSEALKKLNVNELIQRPVQTVPLDVFMALGRGDLLFIDSSHAVKTGSDVNYLLLEVLPRLQSGVIVHIHDICFPYDYQRDVLQTFIHWSESTLVHAFLINNAKARIIFCLSQLHYDRRADLQQIFPDYKPQDDVKGLMTGKYGIFQPWDDHFPSSLYIEIQ